MKKQTAAFKREAQKRTEKAQKGWNTRLKKQAQEQSEYIETKRQLAASNKEIEILQSALKSAENALFSKKDVAINLHNERNSLQIKIRELNLELKAVEEKIIDYKSKCQSDINILS